MAYAGVLTVYLTGLALVISVGLGRGGYIVVAAIGLAMTLVGIIGLYRLEHPRSGTALQSASRQDRSAPDGRSSKSGSSSAEPTP